MEVSGFFTAVIVGVFVGALGRVVLPGRHRIGMGPTLAVGVVAAVVGTVVAGLLDVAETMGVDWVEIALQIGFAAAGIAAADRLPSRRSPTRS